MEVNKIQNVDQYIEQFPVEVQSILNKIRDVIKKNAVGCTEQISYGMPGYKYKGKVLVYFAGYKKHIGFYATPSGHTEFKKELSEYKQGKRLGAISSRQAHPLRFNKRDRKV